MQYSKQCLTVALCRWINIAGFLQFVADRSLKSSHCFWGAALYWSAHLLSLVMTVLRSSFHWIFNNDENKTVMQTSLFFIDVCSEWLCCKECRIFWDRLSVSFGYSHRGFLPCFTDATVFGCHWEKQRDNPLVLGDIWMYVSTSSKSE